MGFDMNTSTVFIVVSCAMIILVAGALTYVYAYTDQVDDRLVARYLNHSLALCGNDITVMAQINESWVKERGINISAWESFTPIFSDDPFPVNFSYQP